ncbi:hypothetical protein THTE_3160 [Thermogutta terrifontis]|uniref:Uncharacterized protein n=1 Tax=Thermogutta terrifontis TaxID=1331910 RepID=A0A286RIK5_9BACT|nr:hypothetical protein THTE_3160 [Thermogutta terrifontis]
MPKLTRLCRTEDKARMDQRQTGCELRKDALKANCTLGRKN